MEACARIIVSGDVQGVFFRDFTQKQAAALGLAGWVHNLPDGRVEAMVQGERDDVLALVEHLRQGPPTAQVADLDFSWRPAAKDLVGFKIRY